MLSVCRTFFTGDKRELEPRLILHNEVSVNLRHIEKAALEPFNQSLAFNAC